MLVNYQWDARELSMTSLWITRDMLVKLPDEMVVNYQMTSSWITRDMLVNYQMTSSWIARDMLVNHSWFPRELHVISLKFLEELYRIMIQNSHFFQSNSHFKPKPKFWKLKVEEISHLDCNPKCLNVSNHICLNTLKKLKKKKIVIVPIEQRNTKFYNHLKVTY